MSQVIEYGPEPERFCDLLRERDNLALDTTTINIILPTWFHDDTFSSRTKDQLFGIQPILGFRSRVGTNSSCYVNNGPDSMSSVMP